MASTRSKLLDGITRGVMRVFFRARKLLSQCRSNKIRFDFKGRKSLTEDTTTLAFEYEGVPGAAPQLSGNDAMLASASVH